MSDLTGPLRMGVIERYRAHLPLAPDVEPVSIGEGSTPLIRLNNLPDDVPEAEVYVKVEGANPTGSFKDRGMTVAITHAREQGRRAVICASTGNTSASAAAYAARARMSAFVLIPQGHIALGKLAQAVVHGATILQVRGNFDDGMRLVKELSSELPIAVVNSINPYRLQGQKTAAFEIAEALGRVPDFHCLPVGNAGNITAHWIGYSELAGMGTRACLHCQGACPFAKHAQRHSRPRMLGYQASGAAPFLRGHFVEHPETVATAIRIGAPQSWEPARAAQSESAGWFDELSDAEILATQRWLASHEGVFCEPASAISLAGALRDLRAGKIPPRSLVVCTLTGHGLKDTSVVMGDAAAEIVEVDVTRQAVRAALSRHLD
jgi:threonine synthase